MAFLCAVLASLVTIDVEATNSADLWHVFTDRKFSELDATLSAYQQRYEQVPPSDPDAERDLSQAFRVFYHADKSAIALYDAWVEAYPRSYAASLARGEHLTALAQKARGTAPWRDVTSEQREAMRHEAKRARAELERSLMLTAKPTLSYQYLIEIAMISSQREDKLSLIERANALDPLNYYPRSAYTFALQPWWGGSIREMEQFLDAYRQLRPPQWKRDCLAAVIVEREPPPRRSASGALSALIARIVEWFYRVPDRGVTKDPANGAPEPLNRAIELCPTAERLATRGRYWDKHERPDLAEQEYRRALEIDPDYVWAQAALGARLVSERKSEEGVALCRAAAERGDAQAQYCLGYAYSIGFGVAKEPGEALRWISGAADNGDSTAIGAMGSRYWSGNGVAQDKDKAIELWRKAARLGDANAKKRLAEVGAAQ